VPTLAVHAAPTALEIARLFPPGTDDGRGLSLDLRDTNGWRLRLGEVPTVALLEAQVVNAVAPFVLVNRLRALLRRSPAPARFVVNVSAVEGQFYRAYKPAAHPHTNMAKAALNMLTRTAAEDLARDGIYMNSVDPGWVSNQNPHGVAQAMDDRGFAPPLDDVDAAARVCDPVFSTVNGAEPAWGCFLKDYRPAPW
jgi:NAD(P)-dependent dehydrogenase (short-subunit alcohol dehydrogenase family)